MKKQWHFLLISIVVLTGLSVVSSCNKEKEQEETIDYSFFDGYWEVIESNELADNGIMVVGDVIDLGFALGGGPRNNVYDIGWEGKRGDLLIIYAGQLDETNNRIFDIYGYISPVGVPYDVSWRDEEYNITKLDKFEMVLKRTAPSNNIGKVVLNKKYSSHYYN